MSTSAAGLSWERRGWRALYTAESLLAQALLILACSLVVVPIVFVFLGSFKSVPEFFSNPFGLPKTLQVANYTKAWVEADVSITLINSVIVTGFAVMVSTLLSCLASYSIARFKYAGRSAVRLLFVGGLVVPVQLIMLPLFISFRDLDLLGSLWPLMITYSTFALPLGVLVLVGFFQALPREITEAATIDGASHLQIFARVVLPLSRPAIFTVVILNGVWIWNDFFVALVLATRPDAHTLPLGILDFFGVYLTEWGLIFASVVISAVPVIVLYLLMTRQFIAGLTAGSVKG